MKLYEINEGESIQITATCGNATAQYQTQVIQVVSNVLLVEPVRHDGVIINFESSSVKMSVIYIQEGEKPVIWENCVVKVMQYQKQKVHAIYSERESKRLNRRQAFRQYVGLPAALIVDETRERIDVTLKDVSTSGMSFVASPSLEAGKIGSFRLVYEDPDLKIIIQLAGVVVREEQVDENKKVFGCMLKQSSLNMNSYVATKQKLEIARRNGK